VVSVTSILGGNSDNTGSGIARRLGNFVTLFGVLEIIDLGHGLRFFVCLSQC